MYRVYCNNSPLYDLRDEDLVLISPIVKIGENTAGSFEFSILPKHPHYEEVNELTSVITAYDGDEEISVPYKGKPRPDDIRKGIYRINNAFSNYNILLKKYGYSMKKIGFTKWKNTNN